MIVDDIKGKFFFFKMRCGMRMFFKWKEYKSDFNWIFCYLLLGVDLVLIRFIGNVKILVDDIIIDKCR